jgi:hypothetical protein
MLFDCSVSYHPSRKRSYYTLTFKTGNSNILYTAAMFYPLHLFGRTAMFTACYYNMGIHYRMRLRDFSLHLGTFRKHLHRNLHNARLKRYSDHPMNRRLPPQVCSYNLFEWGIIFFLHSPVSVNMRI